MQEPTPTKVCPQCVETIQAAAKICPFCQSRLSRVVFWGQGLLTLAATLMLLGLLAGFGWWFERMDPFDNRESPFKQSDLRAGQVALERAKTRPEFWVSGLITNQGKLPWRVHGLEVRLLDSQSNLCDVIHVRVQEPFVAQPGQEHAFRVTLDQLAWTNSAINPQVRVESVSDGNRPFRPD